MHGTRGSSSWLLLPRPSGDEQDGAPADEVREQLAAGDVTVPQRVRTMPGG
jgi:hypothetical protein